MNIPDVSYAHLLAMSDHCGLFEHAKITTPRTEHGYCVDDVARGLVAVAREPRPSDELAQQGVRYLRFLADAQARDGRFHNRRGADGRWEDEPGLEDHWGRAVWALGEAVAGSPAVADKALAHFDLSARRRSTWPRSMAYAALGAAAVLRKHPGNLHARALLESAVALIGMPDSSTRWRWTEPRLRYGNAVLPEALIAAGSALGDENTLADGLSMLGWLLRVETNGDHLSVTPVGGWGLGDPRPGFDQQPIEVAALADACARAFEVTGDQRWRDAVLLCAAWFLGANDIGASLHDPVSGGGCDGLERDGRNENQGAESTLALICTLQHAHRLGALVA